MVNVLVAYASKHGSTREIAETIERELSAAGLSTELKDVAAVDSLDSVDAVVLGSAIYVGQCQPAATRFVEQFGDRLSSVPVWLFSSGPIGEDPFPTEEPAQTADLVQKVGARDYRNFAGKLDRSKLGFGERLVTRVVRAPEGDFRNWQEIRDWARGIASFLDPADVPSGDQDAQGDVDRSVQRNSEERRG